MELNVPTFAAVAIPESLITTKILPPEFGAKNISRLALVKHFFAQGSVKKVLSVVAAVGSGKSTLLAEVSDVVLRQGDRVCWLNLDVEDNNPSLFAAYFVYALQAFDQTLAQNELAQLRGNQTHDLSALFDRLLGKIEALPNRCVLFLDDFQHLTDPILLKIIDRFIAHLPANVRMVIASRTSLPLEFARLKVSGILEEIEQESLNLDLTGVAALMSHVHGLDLSASDLEALQSTTEGWMAGLQLAALALQSHPGPARELIDSFSGRDKDLASYLLDCVLKHLTPNTKAFLMATSPLRRMCAELCDVVTESAESQVTLESIHRSKLFLIPMDRNGLWYRYHHLFGEFLQTELRRSDPDRYRKTCDIAALWCERNGQTTEAIQYALDGGNFACATELITRYALELSQKKGDHFTILEWMRRLPVEHQNSRPEILLSHAWSLAFSRYDQPARELVEQAMDKIADRDVNPWHLSPAERIRWSQIARVTLAVVNAASDQLESCLEASLTLIDELPEDDAFSRASVGNCMAYCHFAKREFLTCAVAASNAQVQGQSAGAEFATGWACFLLGLSELELGRLASTNEQSEQLEKCAKGSPVRYLSDLSNLLKAEIASHTGDFDRAADLAERGKSFPDFFGAVEPMFLAIRGQARAMEWAGDVGAALRTLLQGKDLALKLQKPRLYNLLTIEEVGLRLNSGDASGASVVLERHGLQGKSEKSTHDTDQRFQILEIRRMLASNRTKEAHSFLRNMQKNAGSVALCLSDLIAIHSLKSVALWMDGRNMEAARELDCAFALVKDGASLYWLYQMGTELQPLLEFLKNHRGESTRKKTAETDKHIETVLLDLIARKCSRPKEAQGGVFDSKAEHANLTKKERRVIALIQNGMSNEQIAKELFVSEATVKWHLHNVYSKLDVKSRTAAVAQARKLALL
jgi:LuxR family maltose regulon positive regulatory protein